MTFIYPWQTFFQVRVISSWKNFRLPENFYKERFKFKKIWGFFCGNAFKGLQHAWQYGSCQFLGKGVGILEPGGTARREFCVGASERPGPSELLLHLPGRAICIIIGRPVRPGSEDLGKVQFAYDRWDSIPNDAISIRIP